MASVDPTQEQVAAGCLLTRMNRSKAFAAIAQHGSAEGALSASVGSGHDLQPKALIEQCQRFDLALIAYFDAEFPAPLRHVPDPPLVLYARGNLNCLHQMCVAVVGARRCSRMGAELAGELGGGLVRGGLTVVSGLARGIDAAAHRGALAGLIHHGGEPGANTVAVMGAGLGCIYPRANTPLARAIVDAGGALISEYPPMVPAAKHRFPERNRLISGLSQGVVIVEAGERSGSLITARLALEQGRDVMAVPGAVAPGLSSGCHRLLRDGAALVESSRDVFDNLGCVHQPDVALANAPQTVPVELGRVLAAIEPVVTTVDTVVTATGLAAADVAAKLLQLELAGFVQHVAEGYIRRPFSRST